MQDKHTKTQEILGNTIAEATKELFEQHREHGDLGEPGVKFIDTLGNAIDELHGVERGHTNADLGRPEGQGLRFQLPAELQIERPAPPKSDDAEDPEELDYRQIEQWACDCIQGFDEKGELALITLLHHLSRSDNAASDATIALYAAFKNCVGLHDDAIKFVIANGSPKSVGGAQ